MAAQYGNKSMAFAAVLLVHSWYPQECCSERDCHPVPCEEISEAPNGGIRFQEHLFEKQRVRPSLDAQCHICIHGWYDVHGWHGHPTCAFIQQGA